MKDLVTNPAETMSSLEIAELTNNRHDNTVRLIKSLINKDLILAPQFEERDYEDTRGKKQPCYILDKTASILVVARQSPEFTAKIIDRWQSLEKQTLESRTPPDNLKPLNFLLHKYVPNLNSLEVATTLQLMGLTTSAKNGKPPSSKDPLTKQALDENLGVNHNQQALYYENNFPSLLENLLEFVSSPYAPAIIQLWFTGPRLDHIKHKLYNDPQKLLIREESPTYFLN